MKTNRYLLLDPIYTKAMVKSQCCQQFFFQQVPILALGVLRAPLTKWAASQLVYLAVLAAAGGNGAVVRSEWFETAFCISHNAGSGSVRLSCLRDRANFNR